ncbi:MAG TPA: hypothetical protein VGK74_05865 [Symbiobacteriaceae bacterium]|jgi:hypothetical protein
MYDQEDLEYEPGPVGESYSRLGPPTREPAAMPSLWAAAAPPDGGHQPVWTARRAGQNEAAPAGYEEDEVVGEP